jgi:hypothetical protein
MVRAVLLMSAVAIFTLLKSKKETQTIIISQYRPPVDAHVMEFPAGHHVINIDFYRTH